MVVKAIKWLEHTLHRISNHFCCQNWGGTYVTGIFLKHPLCCMCHTCRCTPTWGAAEKFIVMPKILQIHTTGISSDVPTFKTSVCISVFIRALQIRIKLKISTYCIGQVHEDVKKSSYQHYYSITWHTRFVIGTCIQDCFDLKQRICQQHINNYVIK